MMPFLRHGRTGDLYKVEDARLVARKLTTTSGTPLLPVATPTPTSTEPSIEPTPLRIFEPEQ